MTTLHYTQGLPGSGKTTWALAFANQAGAVYVATDHIRAHLYGQRWVGVPTSRDPAVRHVRDKAVFTALRDGRDVVVDSCNLDPAKTAHLEWIADLFGARIRVADFTGVPVEVCVARALASRGVTEDRELTGYIRSLHNRFLAVAVAA